MAQDSLQPPAEDQLPLPGSAELVSLVRNAETRLAYEYLYKHRRDAAPPSMVEIRQYLEQQMGGAHSQSDRRVRDLRQHFIVEAQAIGAEFRYRLTGRRPKTSVQTSGSGVSSRVEAQVYELKGYRCAMCGQTPLEDGVKLQIDHKVPKSWGGSDEIDNLQPLCTFHNHGKQNFVASLDEHAEQIKAAFDRQDVRERIGELLKAFNGEEVHIDLIELVAREENRGDPTRRLRDLRALGWDIPEPRKKKEGTRTVTYYRAVAWEPWPEGGAGARIAELERDRKRAQRARQGK